MSQGPIYKSADDPNKNFIRRIGLRLGTRGQSLLADGLLVGNQGEENRLCRWLLLSAAALDTRWAPYAKTTALAGTAPVRIIIGPPDK